MRPVAWVVATREAGGITCPKRSADRALAVQTLFRMTGTNFASLRPTRQVLMGIAAPATGSRSGAGGASNHRPFRLLTDQATPGGTPSSIRRAPYASRDAAQSRNRPGGIT